jgi:DNA (cytosine-5)-methyltransferase 1
MTGYSAIDVFSGCGGLSHGLRMAGFRVLAAFDNDPDSIATYRLNHPQTRVFEGDIRVTLGMWILTRSKSSLTESRCICWQVARRAKASRGCEG